MQVFEFLSKYGFWPYKLQDTHWLGVTVPKD